MVTLATIIIITTSVNIAILQINVFMFAPHTCEMPTANIANFIKLREKMNSPIISKGLRENLALVWNNTTL